VGKKQLAVEYGWQSLAKGRYRQVFFVKGETVAVVDADMAGLAAPGLLDLPEHGQAELEITVGAVVKRLQESGEWLILFDNLDGEDVIAYVKDRYLSQIIFA